MNYDFAFSTNETFSSHLVVLPSVLFASKVLRAWSSSRHPVTVVRFVLVFRCHPSVLQHCHPSVLQQVVRSTAVSLTGRDDSPSRESCKPIRVAACVTRVRILVLAASSPASQRPGCALIQQHRGRSDCVVKGKQLYFPSYSLVSWISLESSSSICNLGVERRNSVILLARGLDAALKLRCERTGV